MTETAHCLICDKDIPLKELLIHAGEVHGEYVSTWPDGSPVIIDTTLEPEDFDA